MGHGDSQKWREDARAEGRVIAIDGHDVVATTFFGEEPPDIVEEGRGDEFASGAVLERQCCALQSVVESGDVLAVSTVSVRLIQREQRIEGRGGGNRHLSARDSVVVCASWFHDRKRR